MRTNKVIDDDLMDEALKGESVEDKKRRRRRGVETISLAQKAGKHKRVTREIALDGGSGRNEE